MESINTLTKIKSVFPDITAAEKQIADFICENVLKGKWKEQSRIPSVREIAIDLEVNPNTVVRAFNYLQEKDVIFNKRGIGYFVSHGGYETTRNLKKSEFIEEDLREIFKKMKLLNISMKQIEELYKQEIK